VAAVGTPNATIAKAVPSADDNMDHCVMPSGLIRMLRGRLHGNSCLFIPFSSFDHCY
jgi:hypothetical protein